MRKVFLLAMIVLLFPSVALATTTIPDQTSITGQLMEKMSLTEINQFIDRINMELGEDIPRMDASVVSNIASKGLSIDWDKIRAKITALFFKEIKANINLMGKLLFLAVLCVLLQNLQNSFEKSAISLLSYSICYIFLMVIAITAFYNAITLAKSTVDNMVSLMEALLPMLISLLAGVGAITSAGLFSPLMLFVVTSVSLIVKSVVLPLIFLAAVLQCVNFFSDKYQISKLAGLLRQSGMVILGFTLVGFIGIITIQGIAGGVTDGITLRTAKYATSTFIPIVGKMFADTVDLVMGASLLLKNAVGLFGMGVLFTICIFPLVKLVTLTLILKLTGALIQPMGDDKMAQCLDVLGDSLFGVFAGVITVALMFFLTITIIIGAGSAALMFR